MDCQVCGEPTDTRILVGFVRRPVHNRCWHALTKALRGATGAVQPASGLQVPIPPTKE